MELVILMGLPGAGKTTFRRARFDRSHLVVSKDLFRSNRRPGRRQAQLIKEALGRGQSVVVDNTNPTRADRAELIQLARHYGASVSGYFFSSSVRASLRRNRQREGKARVPDVAIFTIAKKLELPSHSEGFDYLFFVANDDQGGFHVSEYREMDPPEEA